MTLAGFRSYPSWNVCWICTNLSRSISRNRVVEARFRISQILGRHWMIQRWCFSSGLATVEKFNCSSQTKVPKSTSLTVDCLNWWSADFSVSSNQWSSQTKSRSPIWKTCVASTFTNCNWTSDQQACLFSMSSFLRIRNCGIKDASTLKQRFPTRLPDARSPTQEIRFYTSSETSGCYSWDWDLKFGSGSKATSNKKSRNYMCSCHSAAVLVWKICDWCSVLTRLGCNEMGHLWPSTWNWLGCWAEFFLRLKFWNFSSEDWRYFKWTAEIQCI